MLSFMIIKSHNSIVLASPWLSTHDPQNSWKTSELAVLNQTGHTLSLSLHCHSTHIKSPETSSELQIPEPYTKLA